MDYRKESFNFYKMIVFLHFFGFLAFCSMVKDYTVYVVLNLYVFLAYSLVFIVFYAFYPRMFPKEQKKPVKKRKTAKPNTKKTYENNDELQKLYEFNLAKQRLAEAQKEYKQITESIFNNN